jgi:uncharacterized membrane protein YeaQ/YmgE (transglycosylase-associated protein family)
VSHRTDYTADKEQAATSLLEPESFMSLFAWIVLGLVSGFVDNRIISRSRRGLALDMALGVMGAVPAGWLFSIYGLAGMSGLYPSSLFAATVGAIAVLVTYHFWIPSSHR